MVNDIGPWVDEPSAYDPSDKRVMEYVNRLKDSRIPQHIQDYWKVKGPEGDRLKREYNALFRSLVSEAMHHLNLPLARHPKIAPDEPGIPVAPIVGRYFRTLTLDQLQKAPRGQYTLPITSFDIETGHNDEILSVGAIRGRIDNRTGEFLVTDTFERYYFPTNTTSKKYYETLAVHKLTPGRIQDFRDRQNATYSKYWNDDERQALLDFFSGSTVMGHNIQESDLKVLKLDDIIQKYKTLDTLTYAENIGMPRGTRSQETMFRLFTGKTEQQMGITPHMSFFDAIANTILATMIYRTAGGEGRDIRYVLNHPGVSYVAHSDVAGTSISKYGYKIAQYKNKGEWLYMDMDDVKDIPIDRLTELGLDKDALSALKLEDTSGSSNPDFSSLTDAESLIYATERLKDTATSFGGSLDRAAQELRNYSLTRSLQLAQTISRLPEEARGAFLTNAGITQSDMSASAYQQILANARLLYSGKQHREFDIIKDRIATAAYEGAITQEQEEFLTAISEGGSGYTPAEVLSRLRRESFDLKQRQRKLSAEKMLEESWNAGRITNKQYEDIQKVIPQLSTEELTSRVRHDTDRTYLEVMAAAGDHRWDDIDEFDRDDAMRKLRYIKQAYKAGNLRQKDVDDLQMSREALTGSYEELVDATDAVIKKNQQLYKLYMDISKIRPYDINQYISSARSHWGGLLSDAKGLVPQFILNPLGRLTDATFGAAERSAAPWNAVQRVWNSGVGGAITGGLTAALGMPGAGIGMAISGGVNALTQMVGNRKQAQMEMRLLDVQNSLNTVGAGISWILTPFKLFGKALKVATAGLGGLSASSLHFLSNLNRFMGTNLNSLGQMGNPLEQLTGVDYISYQRAGLMDVSSLLSHGSTNADVERFAIMQRNLYRFGQLDTGKVLAANMLGVFSDAFTPTTDAKGAYYNMANKILHNMQGQTEEQRADTLYYASQLSGTLAQILRSALMEGVDDVRKMEETNGMYWRPIDKEKEEPVFRRAYKEYNVAMQQWGFTKQRLSVKLWDTFGRDLIDGFNRIVDAAATGKWDEVGTTLKSTWGKVKTSARGVWDEFSDQDPKEWFQGKFNAFKEAGISTIKDWAINAAKAVVGIWTSLFTTGLKKIEGLLAELTTIKVGFHWNAQDRTFTPYVKYLRNETGPENETLTHKDHGVNVLDQKDAKWVDLLNYAYDGLWGKEKGDITYPGLRQKLIDKHQTYSARGLDYSNIDFDIFKGLPGTPENIDALLTYYYRAHVASGYGAYTQDAAVRMSGIDPQYYPGYESKMSSDIQPLIDVLNSATGAIESALGVTSSSGGAVPSVPTSGEQKFTFELKFGDKKMGASYVPGKGVSLMGIPAIGSVQMGNGWTIAVNQQQ